MTSIAKLKSTPCIGIMENFEAILKLMKPLIKSKSQLIYALEDAFLTGPQDKTRATAKSQKHLDSVLKCQCC